MDKDFRLLIPTLGLWVGCAASFLFEAKKFLFVFLGCAIVSLVIARMRKRSLVFVLFVALGVLNALFRIVPLSVDVPEKIERAEFVVVSDPQPRIAHGQTGFETKYSVRVQELHLNIPLTLFFDSSTADFVHAVPTSVWSCPMRVTKTSLLFRSRAFGQCSSAPQQIRMASRYQDIATHFRNELAARTYLRDSSDAAALLPGLIDGDTRGQSSELAHQLQMAGLGHLTAVSGANVAILFSALSFMFRRSRPHIRLVALALGLIVFVVVARPSPSVVRASVMAGIALAYWWFGLRKYAEVMVLVASIFLLAIDPWLSVSVGFLLSVSATLGLIIIPSYFSVEKKWQQLVVTALSATMATLPILIAMNTHPTFGTIPANVFAEVFVAPATIIGFVALVLCGLANIAALGTVFSFLGGVCVWLGIHCADAIVWIAHHVNDSFFSLQVISPRGLLALSVAVFLLIRWRKHKHALAIAVVVSLFTLVIVTMPALGTFPQESWDVVACDVGQGDASVIRTSQHSALVIDSGADAELMNACLEKLEIDSVDLFIPSHFHADHVGGIEGMARNREVKMALIPQCHEPAGGYSLVSAMLPRTSLVLTSVGQSVRLSSRVTYQVLAISPCAGDAADGTVINNSSVVVLVTIAGGSILFTGDIEEQAQQELQSHYPLLKTTLVKIPHHGSRYQSGTLASHLRPVFAWASVGENNPYGHPAPSTISMYREVGAQVVTTMECGAISMRFAETFTWRGSRSCHA